MSETVMDRCPVCGEPVECEKFWRLKGPYYCFLFRCTCTDSVFGRTWRRIWKMEDAIAHTREIEREEEEREKRAREEFMKWLQRARELEKALCHKCIFWFREGRYCVAVNEGRYSLLFKPEEGVCKDFIEEIATIEWWAPESWLKLGRRGKTWLLCSAASCGPYEYKRPIALTTRVMFTDEEVRALVEALESGKSGPFEVIEPENERGLCVLRRTDRRNELFYFPPESVKKIRAVLGEVIR